MYRCSDYPRVSMLTERKKWLCDREGEPVAMPIADGFPDESTPIDRGAPRFETSWRITWSIVGLCLVLVAVVVLFLMRIAVPA